MFISDFVPVQDENSIQIFAFFQNLKAGRLTTTYCPTCKMYYWQPRIICPQCLSKRLEWKELPQKGKLHAFSVNFSEEHHCIGVIELMANLRILSSIEGDYERLAIGAEVSLKIIHLGNGKVFFEFVI